MQLATTFAAGLLFSALNMPAPVQQAAMDEGGFQPVYVGGIPGPACPGQGEITRTTPMTDGILSVRNGPQNSFAKIDLLQAGDRVWVCDQAGDWLGIVYAPAGTPGECGNSATRSERTAYDGTCRAGWVPAKRVQAAAG